MSTINNLSTHIKQGHLIPHDKALEYIMGGNSTFTFKSLKTGHWFTYKSTYVEKFGEGMQVIKLLTGSDNTHHYSYLCTIRICDLIPRLFRASSRIPEDAKSFVVFHYVFHKLLFREQIPMLEIWHEGKCCRCGRKLTVPESIASGIGPECANKLNKIQL